MTIYQPIDSPIQFKTVDSDIFDFQLRSKNLRADFLTPPNFDRLLRVVFCGEFIVRLLDDFALCTEEDSGSGLIPNHFAYKVLDSRFERSQSETWKEIFDTATHYRFITGWTCMDVISTSQPIFEIIDKTISHSEPNTSSQLRNS